MSELALVRGQAAVAAAARCSGARDGLLLTLVLYTLVRSSEALAGDALPLADSAPQADAAKAQAASAARLLTASPDTLRNYFVDPPFSATEFRPRPRAPSEVGANSGGFALDKSQLDGTTVAQEMEQFKSQGRVRLLTLWQTRAATLSLQSNKHGGPSLQLSSPWGMRGDSSHGLFDHLFAPSRGAGNSRTARPVSAPALAKPVDFAFPAAAK